MSGKSIGMIRALADGLTGFLTFESRCAMSQIHNEYMLYRPIVEIVRHRVGWSLQSEWYDRSIGKKVGSGDHKRIDFVFQYKDLRAESEIKRHELAALEVKWARGSTKSSLDVSGDVAKLNAFLSMSESASKQPSVHLMSRAYLLVAGIHRFDESCGNPRLSATIKGLPKSCLQVVNAAFKPHGSAHCYGVAVFEIKS